MNNRRNKNNKQTSKREKAGFYIAFSLCLAAVGLSVWSAYSGVTGYFKDNSPTESGIHEQENTENVDKNLTDITDTDEIESTEASDQETETDAEAVENTVAENSQATENSGEAMNQQETQMPEETENTAEEPTEEIFEDEDIVETILRVNKNLGFPTESKVIGKLYSEEMVFDSTMRDYRAHMGTDFTCSEGDKVLSMCDGTVEEIYISEMMGTVVRVSSGEFSITYSGLEDEVLVRSGDQISKGQEIGTAKGVPCEAKDGCHIHVEIVVRNRNIDPLTVIENES